MKLSGSELTYQVIIYVTVTILLLLSIFPLLYVLGLSLVTEQEWIERGSLMLIPRQPTLSGYRKVFHQSKTFLSSFRTSVLRTIVGTTLTLLMTLCTGYVLSRRDLPGKKGLLFLTMITILYSGGLIPTFLVVNSTKIYNTFWSLIIPGLVDSWGVLVFKQFFENLPLSVEESAYIDGAGELTLMTRIVVPMSKPVMAALGLFMAVGHWNSWFDALIYIKDDSLQPLQLILRNMFINANIGYDLNMNEMGTFDVTQRVSNVSLRMVITVIGTVPILLVYPFLQKYFTKGVYVGSIKG
jgi:putative aldouronate transport system permease protein